MKHLRVFVAVLTYSCWSAAAIRADNWPQWRGPTNDGIVKETGLPTTWGEDKNLAWKLPLPGRAGSTPAVWGGRIFLTSGKENGLVLLCVSTKGTILWERPLAKAARGSFRKDEANEASASPSTDGKHVFTFVATGEVACHDFDGNQVWKFNAQDRYGKFQIQHGVHITPLLHDDHLYLVLLHSNGHWIIAIDKTSGKESWKVRRVSDAIGECKEAYSSPVLWNDGKRSCLVVLGCDYTTGHSLKDGAELWRLGELNPKDTYSSALRIIASPVAAPDLLVAPTARGGLVVAVKAGANGKIGPGSPFEAWRNARGAGDVPSPLIHGGLVYLPQDNGVLMCVEANSGKLVYKKDLIRDRYRASPILVDGNLIVTSRDQGVFSVVKAGPNYELVAENHLKDEFAASPVVAGGRLYLRGFRALYAVSEGGK